MSDLQPVWAEVIRENPRHRSFLEAALAGLRTDEETSLESYVDYLGAQGYDTPFIASAYGTLLNDTLREQLFFRRHKRYRHATYADVAGSVYNNPDYMLRYMIGLALSSFIWPNHTAMRRHFIETLPRGRGGRYLEIGPGHGFYFVSAIEVGGFERCVGVDISETSCALTRSVVDHFFPTLPTAVEVVCQDFLGRAIDGTPFDVVVMGEVLEHVENPVRFLERLVEVSHADTHIHLTTCANAPAIDHIYLYRTVAEVEAQFAEVGLEVRDRCLMPYVGKTIEVCEAQGLPVNVAYVLGLAE